MVYMECWGFPFWEWDSWGLGSKRLRTLSLHFLYVANDSLPESFEVVLIIAQAVGSAPFTDPFLRPLSRKGLQGFLARAQGYS